MQWVCDCLGFIFLCPCVCVFVSAFLFVLCKQHPAHSQGCNGFVCYCDNEDGCNGSTSQRWIVFGIFWNVFASIKIFKKHLLIRFPMIFVVNVLLSRQYALSISFCRRVCDVLVQRLALAWCYENWHSFNCAITGRFFFPDNSGLCNLVWSSLSSDRPRSSFSSLFFFIKLCPSRECSRSKNVNIKHKWSCFCITKHILLKESNEDVRWL